MKNSMKSFTVAASAAGLLALGACTSAAPTTEPTPPPMQPAPVAPAAPAPAQAPSQHHDTTPNQTESNSSNSSNSNSDSTANSESESSTPSRTGYQNGLPGYMQCGVRCGDEPSSADIQSGRASSPYSGSDSSGGAGSESIRQYQQWYGPGGPGTQGQLPGEITPECDATCARGN